MGSEWIECSLGDFLTFKNGKTSPDRNESYGVPVYGSNGIIGFANDVNAQGKSLIIGRVGTYCGSIYHSEKECWVTDNAISCVPKAPDESEFWYFKLLHLHLNNHRSGSGQPLLNQRTLCSITTRVPSQFETRQRIGYFLMDFNRKIELNRQMNATLEAMAQALFKSWFVDFDPVIDNALAAGNPIPDELAERAERRAKTAQKPSPEQPPTLPADIREQFPDRFMFTETMGWVPEGWQVVPTEQVSLKIGMGPFGSNIKVSTFVKSGVPIISGQHLKGTLLKDADFNYITEDHARKLQNSLVTSGDVIFTHAGSIGQVALIPEGSLFRKYVISQRQFYLRPDTAKTPSSYLLYFFRSHQGQHLLLANASQVGVPSIARPSSHLKLISLLLPRIRILEEFDKQCAGIFNSQRSNDYQIEILETLRNTLLPKLLSGQLRIPEAEQMLAEAL